MKEQKPIDKGFLAYLIAHPEQVRHNFYKASVERVLAKQRATGKEVKH